METLRKGCRMPTQIGTYDCPAIVGKSGGCACWPTVMTKDGRVLEIPASVYDENGPEHIVVDDTADLLACTRGDW
jgi:hypothetical protein